VVGYEPSELLGQPCSLVLDRSDVATARRAGRERNELEAAWTGLVAFRRHRDGSQVAVEVSGRPRLGDAGQFADFEGMGRLVDDSAGCSLAAVEVRARVEGVLTDPTVMTAFQRSVVSAQAPSSAPKRSRASSLHRSALRMHGSPTRLPSGVARTWNSWRWKPRSRPTPTQARALGAAMVTFATGIGATLTAEGIETDTELATVAGLGVKAGQGYLLGRPSVRPEEWSGWQTPPGRDVATPTSSTLEPLWADGIARPPLEIQTFTRSPSRAPKLGSVQRRMTLSVAEMRHTESRFYTAGRSQSHERAASRQRRCWRSGRVT
jgi:hypothetical protein